MKSKADVVGWAVGHFIDNSIVYSVSACPILSSFLCLKKTLNRPGYYALLQLNRQIPQLFITLRRLIFSLFELLYKIMERFMSGPFLIQLAFCYRFAL